MLRRFRVGWTGLMLGIASALLLLGSSLACSAMPAPSDCEMPMQMSATMRHTSDKSPAAPQVDCAIGCPLAPQLAPAVSAPVRVTYRIDYPVQVRLPPGIAPVPDVPPPRDVV